MYLLLTDVNWFVYKMNQMKKNNIGTYMIQIEKFLL